jgi:hypothetical protein
MYEKNMKLSRMAQLRNAPKCRNVIAIPEYKLIRKSMLMTALQSHENLTKDDINYIIDIVVFGYNRDELPDKLFSHFILHLHNLTYTGKFSLTFNKNLDKAILKRNMEWIKLVLEKYSKNIYLPEVYSNQNLSDKEKKGIVKISRKEYLAILRTLQKANIGNIGNLLPKIVCESLSEEQLSVDQDGIYYNSLYSQCYNNICLYESKQIGKITDPNGDNIRNIYISDGNNDGKKCYDLMKIIRKVITSPSGPDLSDRMISQIKDNYSKEIKMFNYFQKREKS